MSANEPESNTAAPATDQKAVSVVTEELPDLTELAPIWRNLEERADGSFFLSWSWIGAWLRSLRRAATSSEHSPTSGLQNARLLTATMQGRVVGLAILFHRRRHIRIGGLPLWSVPSLYLHQTGVNEEDAIYVEYNGLLLDKEAATEARAACIDF